MAQKPLGKASKPKKQQTATNTNKKANKPQKAKKPDKKPHWRCHICEKNHDLEKCKECKKCGHPKCNQCERFTQNRPKGDRKVVANAGEEAVPRVLEQKKVKEDVAVVVVSKAVSGDRGANDKAKGVWINVAEL